MKKNLQTDKEGFAERFNKLLESLGINAYQLAKALDTNEAIISKIKSGKSLPNTEFYNKLLNYKKVINVNWLLSGVGEMFLTGNWVNEVLPLKDEIRIVRYQKTDAQLSIVNDEKINYKNNELTKEIDDAINNLQSLKAKIIKDLKQKK